MSNSFIDKTKAANFVEIIICVILRASGGFQRVGIP